MKPLSENLNQAIGQLTGQLDAPFFLYDLDGFEQHIKQLAQSDLVLWYAVKANPLSAVIKVLAANGFGFDVASVGELDHVLAQGVEGDRILHTGPAKSRAQLAYFLDRGVQTYVVESFSQLNDLQQLAANYDFTPQVLLRVQLQWDEQTAGSNPLGGASLTPFGLSANDWSALDLAAYPAINIKGLHIFQWGNILSVERLSSLWQAMLTPLSDLASQLGIDYQILDLGGGLGIPYDGSEVALNWCEVDAVLTHIKALSPVKQLWMELGRYAIGSFGYYVNPVIESKTNAGQAQLMLQGGINHIMRPAISGQPFPASLLRQSSAAVQPFSVYGPLCTGLDKLGEFDLASDITVGDYLVFQQCGAYGFSESMPFFLCHTLPAEAVLYQGQVDILRMPKPASWWLV